MAILVTCPCGKQMKVKDELAGKRGKCPACGQALLIPTRSPSPDNDAHPPSAPRVCPACRKPLRPEAVICVNCGLNLRTGEAVKRPLDHQERRTMKATSSQRGKSGLLIGCFSVIVLLDLLPWYYVTYSAEGSGLGLRYTTRGNGVIFGLEVWWGIVSLCFSLVGLAASIWTPRNTMRGASIAVSTALIALNILGASLIFAGFGLPLDLPMGAQRPSRLTLEVVPIAPIPIVIIAIVALIRARKIPREEA